MKKYLMTGMAAIMFCGVFTSCSHDMDLGDAPQSKVIATYEEAFQTRFGTPAANQDWGFGSDTRANTRKENANANEWADPDKEYGGLLVPPPLTDEQIAVVKKYFQTHPNLGYEDPKWSNYFIQQVYKGHTDVPEGCATPEQYLAANGGSYIIASDHMDHLVAVDPEKNIVDHINNFNHGDCGVNNDVLDNGEHVGGAHHSDKIMYMKNSTTKSFGYYNSDGSLYHTEYTGLVSYKTIMQAMGAEANCLDDGWNRSFMGFDFEQIVGEDVYAATRVYGNYSEENNWQGELISTTFESYHYFTFEGVQYHYLDSDRNMYAADRTETKYGGVKEITSDNDKTPELFRDLLSKGYLPVINSADKVWVKVGGTADGYFSDWIVTLTEAKTENTPPGPTPDTVIEKLRVIAEDLSVGENTDFDFNDVVFDVIWTKVYADQEHTSLTSEKVEVELLAAGGTLPLYVDGKEVHDEFDKANENLSITVSTMVNTHATSLGGVDNAKTVKWETTKNANDNTIGAIANSIVVKVTKNGTDYTLSAPVGAIASKIGVGTDYEWCNERQDIDDKYHLEDGTPLFKEWVQGTIISNDWYTYAKRSIDEYRAAKAAAAAAAQGNQQP